jgi:hypothetical protein
MPQETHLTKPSLMYQIIHEDKLKQKSYHTIQRLGGTAKHES